MFEEILLFLGGKSHTTAARPTMKNWEGTVDLAMQLQQ